MIAHERTGCAAPVEHDLVLRGGTIYDGTGSPGVVDDIAIHDDVIVAIGDLGNAVGQTEIDVEGLAVAPGFVNMLSWATSAPLSHTLIPSPSPSCGLWIPR